MNKFPLCFSEINTDSTKIYKTMKPTAINPTMGEKPKNNCICVPSGRCHSHSLAGCPHRHTYITSRGQQIWKCDI